MIIDWTNLLLNAVGGVTAFVCLFDGTRRICAYQMDRKVRLMAGLGAAFYLVFGGFAFWNYLDLAETLSMRQQRPVTAQPVRDAGKGLSPEKREADSIERARQVFWESGKFEPYLDRLNEKKLFHPSQADITRRELLVTNQAQLAYAARSSFTEALLWLLTGLLAVVFGYGFSRERLPGPAGPAVAAADAGGGPRPPD